MGEYDLLFIDGDHSYEGCLADLEKHFPRLAPGGHVLLHDCYREEVRRAVIDFVARHQVTILRSPYIGVAHWETPYGSLVHFTKPASTAGAIGVTGDGGS
jgi:predicted O-methyltransferase YrrM